MPPKNKKTLTMRVSDARTKEKHHHSYTRREHEEDEASSIQQQVGLTGQAQVETTEPTQRYRLRSSLRLQTALVANQRDVDAEQPVFAAPRAIVAAKRPVDATQQPVIVQQPGVALHQSSVVCGRGSGRSAGLLCSNHDFRGHQL